MKSCFTVWSNWNLPFSLKPFLLPSPFIVDGLMERKWLHCSVVRDHLNYKFNLWFTATFHHSSSCFYFLQLSSTSVWVSAISNGYKSLSTSWITVKTYFSASTDRDSPKTNLMVCQAWLALPLSNRLECKLKSSFECSFPSASQKIVDSINFMASHLIHLPQLCPSVQSV